METNLILLDCEETVQVSKCIDYNHQTGVVTTYGSIYCTAQWNKYMKTYVWREDEGKKQNTTT